GVVLVVLGDGPGEVEGERGVGEEGELHADAGADGGADGAGLEILLDQADVGEGDPAEALAGEGEGVLGGGGGAEIAADAILVDAGAGADAAELEAADAAQAAAVEAFEERRAAGDVAGIGAEGEDGAAVQQVLAEGLVPVPAGR